MIKRFNHSCFTLSLQFTNLGIFLKNYSGYCWKIFLSVNIFACFVLAGPAVLFSAGKIPLRFNLKIFTGSQTIWKWKNSKTPLHRKISSLLSSLLLDILTMFFLSSTDSPSKDRLVLFLLPRGWTSDPAVLRGVGEDTRFSEALEAYFFSEISFCKLYENQKKIFILFISNFRGLLFYLRWEDE